MATKISQEKFKEILMNGPIQFYRQKEIGVPVELTLTSPIYRIEPGEVDLAGRIWNPPTTDANGLPLIDKFTGKPKEPWTKYEVKCKIKGVEYLYSLSGEKSLLLRSLARAICENDLGDDIIGTKWVITRTSERSWNVEYKGRENVTNSQEEEALSTNIVKDLIMSYKSKHPNTTSLSKASLIQYICFESELKPSDAQTILSNLVKSGFVKQDGDKIIL